MIELKINAESEAIGDAFVEFLAAHKEAICKSLNMALRENGHLADSYITTKGKEITLWAVAPEKGYVLGEIDDITKWEIIEWKYLEEDKKYIRQTKEGLTLYLKSEAGIPDVMIGQFISIDDAVVNANSQGVQNAIMSARASKKEQLKQIKKLQKQGKLGVKKAELPAAAEENQPKADGNKEGVTGEAVQGV